MDPPSTYVVHSCSLTCKLSVHFRSFLNQWQRLMFRNCHRVVRVRKGIQDRRYERRAAGVRAALAQAEKTLPFVPPGEYEQTRAQLEEIKEAIHILKACPEQQRVQ